MWMQVKRFVYWLGIRPKFRSIFYSPSLSLAYAYKDHPSW